MKLAHRSNQEEIMDDLNIRGQIIDQTLHELDVINKWLGGNQISLAVFNRLRKQQKIKTLADLGCGSGSLMHLMNKLDATIKYTGIDANPYIIDYAKKKSHGLQNLHFSCENILSPSFEKQSFDLIHCCLFLHHFTHNQLVEVFSSFKQQARVAIIVNDLHRHYLAYHSIALITRFFSRSYMVKNDARLSVARGFKRKELKAILKAAGIDRYILRWRWAFRWELVIMNP